ncbi:unnamed protein product, partial [Schistosoma rodhaini]|uniref:Uncharacterized protein n=1 Tax=Schistosoma rodhaini TaxID=6188 RepID=A0AA85FXU3_9TREM
CLINAFTYSSFSIIDNTLSSIPQLSPSLSSINGHDGESLSSNKNDNITQTISVMYSEQSTINKNGPIEEEEEEKRREKIKEENESMQPKTVSNGETDHVTMAANEEREEKRKEEQSSIGTSEIE